MSRLAAILPAAVLLASCAGTGSSTGPAPHGTAARPHHGPEVTYLCDDLTLVVVQYGLHTAIAKSNNGEELALPLRPAGSGLYASGTHSFQVRTGNALWSAAARPPVLCRIQR